MLARAGDLNRHHSVYGANHRAVVHSDELIDFTCASKLAIAPATRPPNILTTQGDINDWPDTDQTLPRLVKYHLCER
jgi:hypothetical protein